MRVPVVVIDERDSSYGEGKGRVDQRSLMLQDASPRPRMNVPLEFVMSDQERRDYSGKLLDKQVNFIWTGIRNVFGGIPRVEGTIEVPTGKTGQNS